MFHTKQEEKPGIAIFLDFWKAFDTVDYLKAALQRFNFRPDILTWFDVIYNNASSLARRRSVNFSNFQYICFRTFGWVDKRLDAVRGKKIYRQM